MKKSILKLLTLFTVLNITLGFNWKLDHSSTYGSNNIEKISINTTDKDSDSDSENNPNPRFHHEVKM